MAGVVPLLPRFKFTDPTGKPLALGWLTVYDAGTTTLAASFQDAGLTVPNTNPVHLDGNGEALLWLDPSKRYKFLLRDKDLVTVPGWPVDDVPGGQSGDLAGASGAGMVGFAPGLANSLLMTVEGVLRSLPVSVKEFGAKGNGLNDDTVALQAAINAVQGSTTAWLYLPPGTYPISSALNVTGALTMMGAGNTVSIIDLKLTTQNGISIATTGKITFWNFMVRGKSTATAGALIVLDSGSGTDINQFASLEQIWFQGGWDQFQTISAATWSVINCLFFSPQDHGVIIEDRAHTDAGDMQIIGCIFSGQPATGTAVRQISAGGLRLTNNKVIQFANGYVLSLGTGVATSDLFIAANSFEAFSSAALTFARGTGVVFGAVQITGNEISGAAVCINMSGDAGPWMSHVEITGNNIGGVAAAGTAIAILGTTDFIIADNTIGGSGTGTGINLGTVVSKGLIHDNTIVGFTLPISNGSAATDIVIHDNLGYNPVGPSAVTPGASPYTFTNGSSPATLYLSATTSITAVNMGGVTSILPAATGANVPFTVHLGPNQSVAITYTGTLTVKRMVH